MQREEDLHAPRARDSPRICEDQLSSGFESSKRPCERHRPSPVTYQIPRARQRNENRPDYRRSQFPPSVPRVAAPRILSLSSSSSSSSSSFCCFAHLKHLDCLSSCGKLRAATEEPSWMVFDSSDESGSKPSRLCSEVDDPKLLEVKEVPLYIPPQPEGPPYLQRAPPRTRETPEHFLEEEKSQPVPSFARINFIQSSAYKNDGVVLVAKSLEIHMGQVPPDAGRPGPPVFTLAGDEETGEKPSALALLDRIARPHIDGNSKLHDPQEFPQTGHPRLNVDIHTASAPEDFDPNAFVLDKMDGDILNSLEFHVKKKMVQRQCGVPTVVVRSMRLFQSVEDLRHVELERERPRPAKRLTRTPVHARSPDGLVCPSSNAVAICADLWQKFPGAKEYYILRPVTPEEIKRPVSGPGAKKPRVKEALFRGTREKYVLLSMQPDELRRIVFHLTVKMLEITRGTFPEVVENSFQIFNSFASRPLPKTIRWGNKVARPKHVLLPFVPTEALSLIDLNIKHKYLVYVWKLPTPQTKSEEEMTAGPSRPRGPEGDVFGGHEPQDPGPPIFILKKVPKGKEHSLASGQVFATPKSQKPPGSPPPLLAVAGKPPEAGAEKSPDAHAEKLPEVRAEKSAEAHTELYLDAPPEKSVRFIDVFSERTLAHEAPPERPKGPREPAVAAAEQHAEPSSRSEAGGTEPKTAAPSDALPLPPSKGGGGTAPGEDAALEKGAGVAPTEAEREKPKEAPLPSPAERAGPPGEGAGRAAAAKEKPGPETEGPLTCAALPPPPGAEKAEGKEEPGAAGELRQVLPPSLVDATGEGDKASTAAEEDARRPPEEREERGGSREVPPPDQKGTGRGGTGTEGAGSPPEQPERPLPCEADLPPGRKGTEIRTKDEAGGRRPGTEEAGKRPKGASVVRASLFLELGLARERLNLHLKKKLDATLRPPQGARLNLDVDVAGEAAGGEAAKKAARRRRPQQRPAARPRAEPVRPFCYVCAPLDGTGSAVETVCWALPGWILEMNGHRVPRVARFESEPPAGCK